MADRRYFLDMRSSAIAVPRKRMVKQKKLRMLGSVLSGVSLALVLLCHDGTHLITVILVLMSLLTLLFLVLVAFAIVRIRNLKVS